MNDNEIVKSEFNRIFMEIYNEFTIGNSFMIENFICFMLIRNMHESSVEVTLCEKENKFIPIFSYLEFYIHKVGEKKCNEYDRMSFCYDNLNLYPNYNTIDWDLMKEFNHTYQAYKLNKELPNKHDNKKVSKI